MSFTYYFISLLFKYYFKSYSASSFSAILKQLFFPLNVSTTLVLYNWYFFRDNKHDLNTQAESYEYILDAYTAIHAISFIIYICAYILDKTS